MGAVDCQREGYSGLLSPSGRGGASSDTVCSVATGTVRVALAGQDSLSGALTLSNSNSQREGEDRSVCFLYAYAYARSQARLALSHYTKPTHIRKIRIYEFNSTHIISLSTSSASRYPPHTHVHAMSVFVSVQATRQYYAIAIDTSHPPNIHYSLYFSFTHA